jgi:thimet oligopeptidase
MNKSIFSRLSIITFCNLILIACQPELEKSSPTHDSAELTKTSSAVDGWDYSMAAKDLANLCERVISDAKISLINIENDTSTATLQSVFGGYDSMGLQLQTIQHVWYMKSVHPDENIRKVATKCAQDYSDFGTTIGLSRKFYDRVAAIDTSDLTQAERLMVTRKLRDFRQAGVDRDQATRDLVRTLSQEITEIGNKFDQTIREDTRFVNTTIEALAGLPQDFIDTHPPDENGIIKISTDYPDYYPVMQYAHDDDLRKALYITARSIGSPSNSSTLKTLIEKRHQLAQLLRYKNYASMAMDGLMMESPENAKVFLDKLGLAVNKAAKKDLDILQNRLKQINADGGPIQGWQSSYLSNLVRQEEYALDAKLVRQYFHFDKVQKGIFDLTESLFGVEIIPWETDTWHKDVTAWELREQDKVIGRFYLDMHPRENKYKHAAAWGLRSGLAGGQVPMSGLATNFPKGLMEHNQVETYLHEFGHLLHNMFSGTQDWLDITGMSMERDFVEAPSQMLEEWIWDLETLQSFATNAQGEPIPEKLVEKMNRARNFTKAMGTAQQLFYSNISLAFYSTPPEELDLLVSLKDLQTRYSPYPYVEGTYFYNNFGHLNGYSSNYYIYQWSLAIATDMFTRFEKEGIRNQDVAKQYRQLVLGSAGSKPAEEFVEQFLGRPFSTDAYIIYLNNL